ncbi:MAG: cyclic nucleotide-binding domain-containing protein [Candidatus Eisenbacteria bacterium]|uniref:Cyclic nucleotide-binding domain-containing protein n=1 Tax=Eiseniibacteriota bacterium TaxID=2212470 RepID=A0A538SMM6_UNCEI|nr:MAG: cyclic nucleotide-binding domain-containing protein [Candidatus Eisenbacteria bacterium]
MADTLTLVERTAFLKSLRVLSSIPLEALAELAGRAREIHCEPGDVVFREGDPNRGTFFVVDGLLEQRRGRALLAVFRPGSAIGELWLEEGEPHESRLVALEPSHLLNIDREDVREGLLEYPEFGAALVQALAHRIHELNGRVLELERTIALLHGRLTEAGIEPPDLRMEKARPAPAAAPAVSPPVSQERRPDPAAPTSRGAESPGRPDGPLDAT